MKSLTNRIFLGAALLVVLSIAAAVYRVNVTVTAQAERELRRELEEAGAVVDEYRTTLFAHFLREARLLADLPKLKAAVATRDPATVQNETDGYRTQIDSDVLFITGPDGAVLASSGRSMNVRLDDQARAAVGSALAGRERTWFWPQAGSVLQMASIPVWIEGPEAPELLGTLSVGFRLDGETARRVRALTNTEVAFADDGRVLAATVPPSAHGAIESALRHGRDALTIGDEDYLLLARALPGIGSGPESIPHAVLLRSRGDLERLLARVHRDLAVSAILAVLAATVLAYGIARTVTRPVRELSATMREMAQTGDLTRRAPEQRAWDDEDARVLGSTFNALTSSIEKFQREAAQRERLSSLGRLSTVIAHEVRNPLMIIKGALHSLRGAQGDPEGVRSAAADIEEEVVRLNRIVTDVLDFARPIAFNRAPANVNDICRDAAKAVSAGGTGIALRLDERLPPIVTDAERMRQTLINVLENAQQAVAGTGSIALTTRIERDGIAIAVRDTGPGIPREALPRIFEPYFTTKRAGTGVGLAVARNIVEGLGGRIAAESGQAGGTVITIHLPATGEAAV